MDPERPVRKELVRLLSGSFSCLEEAKLVGSRGDDLFCDVLAVPRDPALVDFPLAFECKMPTQDWHYGPWSKAIKQASDYVGAVIRDDRVADPNQIAASFLFPAPSFVPKVGEYTPSDWVRPGFEQAVAGMFHLALQYRVGRFCQCNLTNIEYFSLMIGPNEVWSSLTGFAKNFTNLIVNSRPIGSGRMPVTTR